MAHPLAVVVVLLLWSSGLTKYSTSPETVWDLNTYKTQQSLLKAIASLPHIGGDTNTGKALDHIYQKSFKAHVGMRTESRKIVVLVTDGKSTDNVMSPSRNLKDNGIEIYTVGVGSRANVTELWSIASEPKDFHLYYVMDSSSFSDIIDNLTMALCTSSKNTESVRLMNGTSLCSGRLEVKLNQSNQWWSSVCEADFDQQDAEVVCRELGCLAPSVLQGGSMEKRRLQCGPKSSSVRAVSQLSWTVEAQTQLEAPAHLAKLLVSPAQPVRLVGGASRCEGTLQVKQRVWRPVKSDDWTLKDAAIACSELDCGSAVQIRQGKSSEQFIWVIRSDCVQSGSTLRECSSLDFSQSDSLEITCLESVRLMNGTSLCSGRLEVKFKQSNQWWSSVCEADFDQQDAEVVCRELGCGSPTVLRGGLYGKAQALMRTKEFQCEGHESALLDCRSSDSTRSTCSPGQAAGLTCSEPVKLVGGASRCEGTLRVKWRVWRPVMRNDWTLKEAAIACRELDCGSALLIGERRFSKRSVWRIRSDCVQSGSTLRECSSSNSSSLALKITCSAPQYPGGFFQLIFSSSGTTYNYNQPAVNHSANFLIPDADHTHQGNYTCVYHNEVFSHNFSSESCQLFVTVLDPIGPIIRLVVLPLSLLLMIAVIYSIIKATRGQKPAPQEAMELHRHKRPVFTADRGPGEEGGIQAAE
ncbi:hypothetical protein INR49_031951 [Caranx melampygus]|nr:hypothetical protein INR49_031951 [Caranx melampygus]